MLGIQGERETGGDVRQGNGMNITLILIINSYRCLGNFKHRKIQLGSPRIR